MQFPDLQAELSLFKRLFELSPNPIWIMDGERMVECNEAAYLTMGYASRDAILCVPLSQLSPVVQPDGELSLTKVRRMMAIAKQQGRNEFEWTHQRASGADMVTTVTLLSMEHDGHSFMYCVWRDITAKREAERALRESEQLYRDVADNGQALIWLAGLDQGCFHFNQPWLRFTGRTMAQEYGNGWAEGVHPDDLERCLGVYVAAFERRERFSMVYRLRRHDGVYRWILDDGAPRYDIGKHFIGYVGHCLDITEQKEIEAQVREMAFYDPLTRLLNRRLLIDRLNQTMVASKRSGCHGALIFLDLDNFKPLNDTYGHETGDALLVEAAQRLTQCVREVDTVARFGGDEFVVILGDLHDSKVESVSQATIIAEKIRSSLCTPYALGCRGAFGQHTAIAHDITASIGVVVFMGNDLSQDELLKFGDAAMYRAKGDGRNQIRFHEVVL